MMYNSRLFGIFLVFTLSTIPLLMAIFNLKRGATKSWVNSRKDCSPFMHYTVNLLYLLIAFYNIALLVIIAS